MNRSALIGIDESEGLYFVFSDFLILLNRMKQVADAVENFVHPFALPLVGRRKKWEDRHPKSECLFSSF